MDVTYANQISLTVSANEVFLRFSTLHPIYDKDGNVGEDPGVSNEKIIVLSRGAFDALKSLINHDYSVAKE